MRVVKTCLWCGSDKLELFAHRHKDGTGIVECKNCGLLMLQEFPENLEEEYYTEEYFNPSASDIDTGYHETYELIAPAFLFWQNSFVEELNDKHEPKRFFEIGTATGNLLEMLRDNQPNLTLSGIDLSDYAAFAARAKGLDVQAAFIEEYNAKHKQDIIFSSETMEHLDNLKSFLGGVDKNLAPDGTFLFYVPSISLKDAKKERDLYLRFNVNLEHLLHFTPEFMEKALGEFFKAEAYIKEYSTDDGPFLVGAVTRKPENLKNLKTFFTALEEQKIPKDASPRMLKNLTILALKFAKFDFAEETYAELEKRGGISKTDMLTIQGLRSFHKGELEKSSIAFEELLRAMPGSLFATRSLLANERLITKLNREQIAKEQEEIRNLATTLQATENELKDIKLSRFIKPAIALREAKRKSTHWAHWTGVRARRKTKDVVKKVVPASVRKPVGRFVRRDWQVKLTTIVNRKLKAGQPLVSVVIPYFNRLDTIGETLESLQRQTLQNFDVILIDDGSAKEQAAKKIDKKYLKGLRYSMFSQENRGVAAARNNGVSRAKGRYVMCLDSDDYLEPTYLEKFALILETNPNVQVVTSDMRHFGLNNFVYKEGPYEAHRLLDANMLTTASMFTKKGWEAVGGYKSNLGYEDWEFWIGLAEKGFWGHNIPEALLNYRSAVSSRYVDDQQKHEETIAAIKSMHPRFAGEIKKLAKQKRFNRTEATKKTWLANLDDPNDYLQVKNGKPNVLITVPWMTFGGAETLIYNFCRELKDDFNISFATGMQSEHEWEYKFREITPNIYHLSNLFSDGANYVEFVSNYISTRKVDVLHIIHNGFTFEMLERLKKEHPKLKVVVTMFNDRVEYFEKSVGYQQHINTFTTDNEAVAKHYRDLLEEGARVTVIPNGINCYDEFNPAKFNRHHMRQTLGIEEDDVAVFFVGRLSVEKNPDVFLAATKKLLHKKKDAKFRFFMVGDGPMRPEVEKTIESIGSPRVQYLGYKAGKEVAECLSTSDVFVLPSAIEGFPLSILEAMAMGAVVVASDVGAVADVVTEGKDGFVVAPGSAEEIADKLKSLEADRKELAKMQENARESVKIKYSNRILGKNYSKLYKSALKNK